MSFQSDLKRHQSLAKIGKGKKRNNNLAELKKKVRIADYNSDLKAPIGKKMGGVV